MQKGVTKSGKAPKAGMALPPAVQRQERLAEFFRLVDMLLEGRPVVFPDVVFEAIEADNHVGLARVLSCGKCNLTICEMNPWWFNSDYAPKLGVVYHLLKLRTSSSENGFCSAVDVVLVLRRRGSKPRKYV